MLDSAEIEDEKKICPPPLPENHGKPLEPVSSLERIVSLDVLRGFGLLGILISNMVFFSQPLEAGAWRGGYWYGQMDWLADWISVFLVEGKFYPIFSLLFGLGFSIQMDRALARGIDPRPVYIRRLFILMGFGLAHGVLLWDGDVLFYYAVCGLVLWFFRNRKPLTVIIWATALILLPALLILLIGFVIMLFGNHPEFSAAMQESIDGDKEVKYELIRAYVTGGYLDAVSYRLRELFFTILVMMVFAPPYLGLFLIGMVAGRKRIITEVAAHHGFLKRTLVVCGVLGLVANFLSAWFVMAGSGKTDYGMVLIGAGISSVFGPVLAFAYVAGILLLIHRMPTLSVLSPISAVGRMAQTNYLGQSLIATTIFYGYGLGLGGNTGRLGTIGIALLIFAGQAVFSVFWLKSFRYGPMEWIWRSLTYGKRQPMRIAG